MPDSTLFNILYSARWDTLAERATALVTAIAHLQSLSSHDAVSQLMYRGEDGWGALHWLGWRFSECVQATSFLSLVIERGRESCGTTALTSLRTNYGETPLHRFAANCSDLSLTKMVVREFPPSLAVLANNGETPLHYVCNYAENQHGSIAERVVFFRAATAAYNASNYVALETLCDGSSPYLARELSKQAIDLRVAVNICLKRQEEAPSDLISPETGIALALLGLVRDFGRDRHSSDLLRRVLEYVGPYASSSDAG